MRRWIKTVCVLLSVLMLAGCGMGRRSCGDEPMENVILEQETEKPENMNTPAEEGEGPKGLPTPEVDASLSSDTDAWGVTLTVKDVTPTGLVIVCTQSGGSPAGELSAGSYYIIEKETLGIWAEVDYVQEMEVCWDAVAWIIPMDSMVEWKVNWQWLYGSLSSGHYRIGKEVMDFKETGNYDESMYYAEFEIK